MAGETEDEIPETGAVFTFGKSKFADNIPSKFWLKNDVPLKITCGDEHTALITENGKLFMFGSNNWGQLGLGSKTMVNKPTCVKALKSEKVRLAACGRNHTIVYTSRGNVYSTGGNNEGQLGLGDCGERTAFQLVDFFSSHGPIKMLAAGSNTSAALTESGTLFMWGDNTEGQIGLGKESSALTPQEVTVGRPVAWVSCGYYHSAFVTVDGGLYTFGECDSGKLGLATGQLDGHRMPQLVKGITDQVTQVACGGGHTVAVTEEDLYTFGLGQFGQLGQGTFIFEARLPRAVDHFRKGRVRQVMCGENHTAVITDNGLLYTFGDGRHGKLGLGEENFTNQFKPTLCPRFLKYNVQAVTCGGCHMLVLAKPRDKSCQEVTLEENDVTEDYLEKSYTELLGDTLTSTPASLNSSLSARVRRRERERSPEQFGIMFRTLPPLTSGHLNTSTPLPVSSQTIPSSLPPKELTNRKVHNGIHQHRSTGSNKKEKRSAEKGRDEGDSSTMENMMDNESVKDLGDTTDFLNMTHVMKMDPSDKTLTLCPVQKRKGKLVKGRGKAGEQPELCTPRRVDPTPRGALPTELLRSSSDRSLVVEKRPRHRAAQGKGSGKENLVVAPEAIKPAEPKAGPAKSSSIGDISTAKSKPCPSAQKKQPFVMDSKAIQIKGIAKGQSAEVKKTLLEVNSISTKVKSQHIAVRRTPDRKSGRHSQGLKLTDALPVDKTTEPDLVSEVPQKTTNENTEREKSKPKTEPPEQTPLRSILTRVTSLGSGVGLVTARQFGSPSDSESVRSQSRAQRFSRPSAEDAQSSWSQSSASMASEPGGKRTAVRINIIPAQGSSDQGVEEEQCRSYSGPPDNREQEERRGEESGDETGSSDDQTPAKQESEGEEEESEGGVGMRRAESGDVKEVAESRDEVTDEENGENDDTVKVEGEDGGISELEEESEGGDEPCKTETDQGDESELEDAEKEESGLEEEEEGDGTSSPVGGEGESVGEEEEEEGGGESKEEEESGEVSHSDTESKSKESNYEEEDEEDGEKEEEGEDESVGSVEEEDKNEAGSGTEEGEEESSTAEEREEDDKSEEEEEDEEEEAGEEEESEDEEEAGEEEESEDDEEEEEEPGEEESVDEEEEEPGEEEEDSVDEEEEEPGEEEESVDDEEAGEDESEDDDEEEEEKPGEEEESEDEEEPGEEEESEEGEEEEGKEEDKEEHEAREEEEEEEVVDKGKANEGQESHQNAAARGNGSKQRSGKGEEFWDNVLPQYLNLK
ncbi:LOW QUALITY PROTEIN: retinitis pigmentosa GTPase regulator b [Oncorhynchus keta]|uniref:LOW QUALITY PROTEIN: retinitis pigmentosa GTPase regulator b n=1 Tax=Oncorhynchus keta TaxID=8018 RepID=UPI00227CA58A|nr:LOW QUALITY PROTEIN: retinitis pigmentosa GTPase regulator b [Oncorhynchus keta]